MSFKSIIAIVFSLFASFSYSQSKNNEDLNTSNLEAGSKMPYFSLLDIKGEEINSNNLKGNVIFINFFFLKCPPCMLEVGLLQELADEYRNKNVIFLSISVADSTSALLNIGREYAEEQYPTIIADPTFKDEPKWYREGFEPQKFELTPLYKNQVLIPGEETVFDSKSNKERAKTFILARDSFKVDVYPTNLIIDQSGVIALVKEGYVFRKKAEIKAAYKDKINFLLNE